MLRRYVALLSLMLLLGATASLMHQSGVPMVNGLRITRVDGQEERLITSEGRRNYASPVWTPDGRWLAAGRTIYEVGKWQPQLLDLPADAEVVAWACPIDHWRYAVCDA